MEINLKSIKLGDKRYYISNVLIWHKPLPKEKIKKYKGLKRQDRMSALVKVKHRKLESDLDAFFAKSKK